VNRAEAELFNLITRTDLPHQDHLLFSSRNALTKAILAAGWREPARTVSTIEELGALPAGVIVHSADGTIACRHHSGVGVVFGDERPFRWDVLSLPLTVLFEGGA
jgi:hypothetical protein